MNSVLRVMKKELMEVAKHPVGMDEIVQDFGRSREEYVENEQQQVQIVGIVGFRGSSKITLSTKLFNRKCSSFESSRFVHDVKQQCQLYFHVHKIPFESINGEGDLLYIHKSPLESSAFKILGMDLLMSSILL